MADYGKLTIRHAQRHQPWTVPYSDNFVAATRYTGPNGRYLMPHLYGAHTVLHAQKTVGKLAAVFEKLDHTGNEIAAAQVREVAAMSADLLTAALRFANLYGFDLAEALADRVEEKNGVAILPWETSNGCDHNWRYSDSSLYDFVCTKCGDTD